MLLRNQIEFCFQIELTTFIFIFFSTKLFCSPLIDWNNNSHPIAIRLMAVDFPVDYYRCSATWSYFFFICLIDGNHLFVKKTSWHSLEFEAQRLKWKKSHRIPKNFFLLWTYEEMLQDQKLSASSIFRIKSCHLLRLMDIRIVEFVCGVWCSRFLGYNGRDGFWNLTENWINISFTINLKPKRVHLLLLLCENVKVNR